MFTTNRDDALGTYDAVGLAEQIRKGNVSPGEVRRAALERAELANAELNAVVGLIGETDTPEPDPELALFRGVPTFVKDNTDYVGVPTRHGSRATPDVPAPDTGVFIKGMEKLGFGVIGKSTMPEFGMTASTETLACGATRNPWNLDHSVGGSSGGAAALVAAGVVPVAHANDGGGSIRIPASCCGLVGLKPTRGRFSTRPEMERLPIMIGHEGILSRTVRDTAMFFHEMGKVRNVMPQIPLVEGPGKRLRIKFFTEGIAGVPISPEVKNAVIQTATKCEELGHQVEEISFPYAPEFGRDFVRYWAALAGTIKYLGRSAFGSEFTPSLLEPIVQELASMSKGAALKLPSTIRRLKTFPEIYEGNFSDCDVFLSPVTAHPAPPIGYLSPELNGREHLVRLLRFAAFTPIQNVSGAPAISVPIGMTQNGTPIGAQFASKMGEEQILIELALELEEAVGWNQVISK